MKIIHENLLDLAETGRFDVIIHGCNCHCSFGAGIAKAIRERFPESYEADCRTESGSREKLGTISYAQVKRDDVSFVIVNGYTQYDHSGPGPLVDYKAVRNVMKLVKVHFSGSRIGYPKIGAGLAKGDWDAISEIITEELEGEDHTLVLLESSA